MRFAVAVLIGCLLSLGQNATSSESETSGRLTSPPVFVQVEPGCRIYFQSVRNENLLLGPAIRSNGLVTVYTLGENGKFTPKSNAKTYTVTKTGVLIPKPGDPEKETSSIVYKTVEPIIYTKGFKDILIPLNILYSRSQQERIKEDDALARYMEEEEEEEKNDFSGESEVISEEVKPRKLKKVEKLTESKFVPKKDDQMGVIGRLSPDKNCNGEITMFILKSDGVMQRMPPDPYLPNGINLSYTLKDNFLVRPNYAGTCEESVVNYITGVNGDLIPHPYNNFKLETDEGEMVSFILGECGSLIPVREERDDEGISYTYNDQVIYKGQQFPDVFSNSEFVMVNNTKYKLPEKKEKDHKIHKRSLYSEEYVVSAPPSGRYYPPVRHASIIQKVSAPPAPIMRQNNLVPIQQSVISRPTQTIVVREPRPLSVRRLNYEGPSPSRVAARVPVGISAEISSRTACVVPPEVPRRTVPVPVSISQREIPVPIPPREIPVPIPPREIPVPIPPREIPVQEIRVPIPQREIPVQQVRVPVAQCEIPLQQVRVPVAQCEVPLQQVRVPVAQCEVPLQQVRVPIPRREIPVQQVRVQVPQREIPLHQVRVPVPEPEIPVIPQTAVAQPPCHPNPPCEVPCRRDDLYVEDEIGNKICLEPEFTDQNDVVLYKLTCKGNLVRFPSCKEPEYGFPIHFKILLEEFVMVPVADTNCEVHITYILQENGDLIPCESNKNTFKKAPGSLLYFMLGKDNVLFPVQQKVDPDGCVTYYFQENYLLKLASTANKPLHFSTLGRPLFVYYNGLTVMTNSSKPRLNTCRGSNWKNHCSRMGESESKDIFLAGPCGQLIRVTPFKTKSGSTVIYEMDSNGILYRSPKDKKRCIILKSYIVLKEGILLPSNETCGYMFMSSKNGDMFPYLYPDGKLEAPQGESMKYLLCEKGILLPMELEIVNNQICYFFLDVIVYKEKVYTKDDLDSLSESSFKLHYKNECDELAKKKEVTSICSTGHFKPFTARDGSVVYYEKCENLLKRHPMEAVPKYLSYTMGSFEIQPDGSLFQIRYQDPDRDIINLMLEPNGDLMEDCRNVRKPSFNYYVLDTNGNLIAVEARKTKKSIYFYKNNVKVCRVSLPRMKLIDNVEDSESNSKKTPLGLDPLRLMDEPEPENGDFGPMCIPVPLKSVSLPEPVNAKERGKCEKNEENESEEGENKEESCKETMALELEINDEVIEEIRNWANKCDKLLSRREVEESLTQALQGLSVSTLFKENPKAR